MHMPLLRKCSTGKTSDMEQLIRREITEEELNSDDIVYQIGCTMPAENGKDPYVEPLYVFVDRFAGLLVLMKRSPDVLRLLSHELNGSEHTRVSVSREDLFTHKD